jgi:RNA-directed DNA polymerase
LLVDFSGGGGRLMCMHKNKIYTDCYDNIISAENLLLAFREFRRGKKHKKDIQEFEYKLMENLVSLHHELKNKSYVHGDYVAFKINDPKPRDIHKATVRDRVLHHGIYRKLSPFYFKVFTSDSYSCQLGKGTHKALQRFEYFHRKVSKNNTKQCWVLKCDIRKFFASVDHDILIRILDERIVDRGIVALLTNIIHSFSSEYIGLAYVHRQDLCIKGLPLGNLTSQLLVNIYMHEFDMYIKQTLKVKYYIRYADDFVVLSHDREYLENVLKHMSQFLSEKLALELHPHKVSIETLGSAVDFLGWVHFSKHRVLRTASKKRMFRKLNDKNVESYRGLLLHGNTYKLQQKLKTLSV